MSGDPSHAKIDPLGQEARRPVPRMILSVVARTQQDRVNSRRYPVRGRGFMVWALWTALLGGVPIVDRWAVFTVPDAPKPAYLRPIFPQPFRLKVTRISGDPGTRFALRAGGSATWGADARHHYS